MDEIPNPPTSLCYFGGPVDIVRNWARLQGASAQQERVILAALDSNYLAKLPKPRKWRKIGTIPRNRAFRSRYYQQVAHILGWKERHVSGFSDAVRDTLKNEVWPDDGGEQGDMATNYPQCIGGKRTQPIHASIEQSSMAKGGGSKAEGAQVSGEEVHINDNIDHTIHIHKRMARVKEASGRDIEDCSKERGHYGGGQDICNDKRLKSEDACKESTGRVLPKWLQRP